jgi:hypothetical protein
MTEKKYTKDGYLVIAESHTCPLWEIDTIPCRSGYTKACFFCRYADFRTPESIRRAEEMPRRSIMYSVCQNEKNKKTASETE